MTNEDRAPDQIERCGDSPQDDHQVQENAIELAEIASGNQAH